MILNANAKRKRHEGIHCIPLLFFCSSCAHISCGYHAVYGGETPARLHVKLVRSLVADAVAGDEVASGVREELAQEGALEAGDGWPRAEVEVLRADEASEGIEVRHDARAAGGAGASAPVARGIDVGIVARAWISPAPGAAPLRDTGDMRAVDLIAVADAPPGTGALDPRAAGFYQADALRAAARRLGHKLGRKLLGRPAATEEARER
jgi:hypothetical protein